MKKWFDLRRWLIMKIEIDDEIKLRNIIKDAGNSSAPCELKSIDNVIITKKEQEYWIYRL